MGSSDRVGGIWREARTFDIGFQGKMWVATGIMNGVYMNDVWSSTDGVNWVQETASGPFVGRFSSVLQEYGGKLHLIGGTSGPWLNDVWCTSDGANWTEGTSSVIFSPRCLETTAEFNGKLWVIGGTASGKCMADVWVSNFVLAIQHYLSV